MSKCSLNNNYFSLFIVGGKADVSKLEDFFYGKLGWKVNVKSHLSKTSLNEVLEDLQKKFRNPSFAEKYYCFAAILNGHGNEVCLYFH